MRTFCAAAGFLLVVAACGGGEETAPDPSTPTPVADETPVPTMTLESDQFADGETIPVRYTCDGENEFPGISWRGQPDDTAEFALLVNDPDAPGDGFVHLVLYGMPLGLSGFGGDVPQEAIEGRNGAGELGWTGPCPPPEDDAHRYVFTLWALDEPTGLEEGATAEELRTAIEGTVVAESTLIGTYDR